MYKLFKKLRKTFAIPCVSNCPSELEPVLAKIEHINSLGKSSWYEVVYFDGNWRCYAGSNTFKDGKTYHGFYFDSHNDFVCFLLNFHIFFYCHYHFILVY